MKRFNQVFWIVMLYVLFLLSHVNISAVKKASFCSFIINHAPTWSLVGHFLHKAAETALSLGKGRPACHSERFAAPQSLPHAVAPPTVACAGRTYRTERRQVKTAEYTLEYLKSNVTKRSHTTPSCVSPGPLWCLCTFPASAAAPRVLRQTGRSSVYRTRVVPWKDAGTPAAHWWGEVGSRVLDQGYECWFCGGGGDNFIGKHGGGHFYIPIHYYTAHRHFTFG